MTISKEKFESIICDEAQKVSPDGWLCGSDQVIEFAHALLKRVEAECEIAYYEYRTWYGENTVNPGWGEWTRVVPRDCRCTVEDAVVEIWQYISAGYKYELRELIALPLVSEE